LLNPKQHKYFLLSYEQCNFNPSFPSIEFDMEIPLNTENLKGKFGFKAANKS